MWPLNNISDTYFSKCYLQLYTISETTAFQCFSGTLQPINQTTASECVCVCAGGQGGEESGADLQSPGTLHLLDKNT